MTQPGRWTELDVVEQLRQLGERLYPDASAGIDVRLCGEVNQTASRLWFADLRSEGREARVVVKQRAFGSYEVPKPGEFPPHKLAVIPEPGERSRCEAEALRRIESMIEERDDPRFAAVHVYELSPAANMLIMSRDEGADLTEAILGASRFRAATAPNELLEACRRCGAWLRLFHEQPHAQGSVPILAGRAEVQRTIARTIGELEPWYDEPAWWSGLRDVLERTVRQLPESFEMVGQHGDFWTGNVLSRPDGRLTVIDTFGIGLGPRYIDLAYFLLHLRVLKQQMYSQGLWCRDAVVSACESAFVSGYGEDAPIDRRTLALFEVLALLHKWASRTGSVIGKSGFVRTYKNAAFSWRSRFYRRQIDAYRLDLE